MDFKDVKQQKAKVRKRLLAVRDNIPAKQKACYDTALSQHITALKAYSHAKNLLLYASFGSEPDTDFIIRQAFSDGKRVAMPRCHDHGIGMDFYEIFSTSDLYSGKYGIPEPLPQKEHLINTDLFDFCLVPALAFDIQGYRIGYGRGYYDRFLEGFPGVKVGTCYSFMVKRCLPRGSFDKSVDIIITEKGVRTIEKP